MALYQLIMSVAIGPDFAITANWSVNQCSEERGPLSLFVKTVPPYGIVQSHVDKRVACSIR